MNFDDPNIIAKAVGASVPAGIGLFFITRKLCGPAGAAELERLKRVAGIHEGESLAGKRLRDWLPWLIGPGGGASVFFVAMVLSGPRGFTSGDLPKLRAGFVEGCVRSCTREGGTAELCHPVCDCGFNQLRTRNGGDPGIVAWFSSARTDPARMKDAESAIRKCAQDAAAKR